jgi:FkbM family methyltransferase
MKTLIYIGANRGYGLYQLLTKRQFDIVYAFEPDPEIFQQLKNNYKNLPQVKCINVACTSSTGEGSLYITENRVSSSLGDVNMSNQEELGGHSGGKSPIKVIQVQTINLKEFCDGNNINHIDLLVTDCQGSDHNILTSMKTFIDNKQIDEIFSETHKDGVEMYIGLNNQLSKFKELLNENYQISYFSADGHFIDANNFDELSKHNEWDTCWKVR